MSEKIKLSERKGEYEALKNMGTYNVGLKFTLDDSGYIVSLKFSHGWEQLEGMEKIYLGDPNSTEIEFLFVDPHNSVYIIHFYDRLGGLLHISSERKEEMELPFTKIS